MMVKLRVCYIDECSEANTKAININGASNESSRHA